MQKPRNDPNDIAAIQKKIDAYFQTCSDTARPVGFAALAYALGYSSRTTLWENANGSTPIAEPLKRALLRIEASYEEDLRRSTCTGAIFALKNRGWTDKQEVEHSGNVKIIDDIK